MILHCINQQIVHAALRRGSRLGILLLSLSSGTLLAQSCVVPPAMQQNLQTNPTADEYTHIGVWFAEQKEYACAAQAFSSALSLQPNSAQISFMLGLSLYSSGEAQQAIAPLEQS